MLKLPALAALAATLITVTACESVPPAGAYAVQNPSDLRGGMASPTVRVGDTLEVYILEDESFNGRYLVRAGGHIIFPRVGRVSVAGASLSDAEARIRHAFETNQLKTATVIVERSAAAPSPTGAVTVTLAGKVETPGRRQVQGVAGRPPMLYEGVLASGGLSQWANLGGIVVTRTSPSGAMQKLKINAKAIALGNAADVPLQNGDVIYVPERLLGF